MNYVRSILEFFAFLRIVILYVEVKNVKKVILTGDRPTGRLHIGHFVGSLRNRVILQNSGNYDNMFVMIADTQALTDNFNNPDKIRRNVIEVALDYLSVGIDPSKTTIFIQSMIPELAELTFYFMNLVTVSRLYRNPTVKAEIHLRKFDNSIPAGFLCYPVSQTADITAFKASIVPVGDDQLPMIEQAREIVRKFNETYDSVLVEPNAMLPSSQSCKRLCGTDGNAKMSKSIGNCIYLSDDSDTIKKRIMSMFTDPQHIKIEDPGHLEGNTVFAYLDAFCTDDHFSAFLPEYKNLDELKSHYTKGGLSDMKVKKFLNEIIQHILKPIREKRLFLQKDLPSIYEMLKAGSMKAREVAANTLSEVRSAMKLDYFN